MNNETKLQTEPGRPAPVLRSGQFRLAQLISNVTAPPLLAIPVYFLLASYDQLHRNLSGDALWSMVLLAVFFGVVFPIAFILALYRGHQVTDIHISVRQQRTVPYLVTIASYFIGFGALYWYGGASALAAGLLCNATITVVILLVNFFWKISAHATGVGGTLAALTVLFGGASLLLYLLLPLVGWARLFLKAHTLWQVLAGSAVGFGITVLELLLVFKPLGWL